MFFPTKNLNENTNTEKYTKLGKMVSVKRDVAEATRSELGGAYEGCLDQFERGMSTERLREVFGELKAGLVPLLRAIQEKVEVAHRASECATVFFLLSHFWADGTFWACPMYFLFVL